MIRPLSVLFCGLLLGSCATNQQSLNGGNTRTTADLTLGRPLRQFTDASSLSIDEFLNLYVLDRRSNTLYKLSPMGDSLRAASGYGHDHYQFNDPLDIDARLTNNVFVADNLNHRVEQYTRDLAYVSTLSTRESPNASQRFGYPKAVACDDAGNLYVADGENNRVIKARPDFSVERTIGGYSDATRPEGMLANPIDLAVDRKQRLIVLDNGGTSLVAYDNFGTFLGREQLIDPAHSIAMSNDTIFALSLSGTEIRLFSAYPFTEQGRWKIVQPESEMPPLLMDIACRNGAVYILSRNGVYRCTLEPR